MHYTVNNPVHSTVLNLQFIHSAYMNCSANALEPMARQQSADSRETRLQLVKRILHKQNLITDQNLREESRHRKDVLQLGLVFTDFANPVAIVMHMRENPSEMCCTVYNDCARDMKPKLFGVCHMNDADTLL